MRPIGFSTGALAYADFRLGLEMTLSFGCQAIELSALRQQELAPLLDSLDTLNLSTFSYVSIHAPSAFLPEHEAMLFQLLYDQRHRNWPIVVHPDALYDLSLWRCLGPLLCVENMDKRKPIGRNVRELERIFNDLPDASFCFDIGHARQCDPTMIEACFILKEFGWRLRQVHISEVNTASRHDVLSYASITSFQEVAHLIPEEIPLILETPIARTQMADEMDKVKKALPIDITAITAI